MGITDKLETFIIKLLEAEDDETVELKRNELAEIFNCVPSQINYVISTRFTPQRGYAVESKRGGGGYLRIRRINYGETVWTLLNSVGSMLSESDACAYTGALLSSGCITGTEAAIIKAAVSDRAITAVQPTRDMIRANIFKNILTTL